MKRDRGYQLKSMRLLAEKSGNRKNKRVSVVGIRDNNHNLLHPFSFKGSMNKELFKKYLSEKLLPNLPKNSYLIMENEVSRAKLKFNKLASDNASFHKGKDIEDLIKSYNINLMYLPPYSPDLNPIEKKWSQIKSLYRKLTNNFEDKFKLIEHVLNYQYAMV